MTLTHVSAHCEFPNVRRNERTISSPVRHAHREHGLVVLLVNAKQVFGRRGRCVGEQRHQQWHIVHAFDMVPYCRDPVWEPSLQPTTTSATRSPYFQLWAVYTCIPCTLEGQKRNNLRRCHWEEHTFTSQSAYADIIRCGSGCVESSRGRNEMAQFQSVSIPMLSASA